MRNADVELVAVEIKHSANQEQHAKALKVEIIPWQLCFYSEMVNLLTRNADNEFLHFIFPYLSVNYYDRVDLNWWRQLFMPVIKILTN